MSIVCTEVEESEKLKKIFNVKGFVRANIDPVARNQLPFPADYEFSPCFLPKKYAKFADRIRNFKVRPDDIWVVTFPKSGTTWIMNTVWHLMNNLDFSTKLLPAGFMFLEHLVIFEENNDDKGDQSSGTFVQALDKKLDEYENAASPRLFKSHLPAHLLPNGIWTVKPKIIYMHRNARDVAISLHHMYRYLKFRNHQQSLEDFFDIFLNDRVLYSPFYEHLNSFQQLNTLDHVSIMNYEEMNANPFAGIKCISEFLNYSYSDEQLKQLTEHVSFQNMRNNYKVHPEIFHEGFK